MSTSGTRGFDPDLAQITVEAYSRAGVRRLGITAEHIEDAILSANYMLADWGTLGFKQFELTDALTIAMVPAQESYTLPAGVLDIWDARLYRSTADDPMFRISRSDYNNIPRKITQGKPDRYYVDPTASDLRTVYLWPVPENNTDVVKYTALRRPEDVTAMSETAPVPYEWQEAFVAGLAYRVAVKYAPQRIAGLLAAAQGDLEMRGGAFRRAFNADRERAPAVFAVTRSGRGRR